MRLPWPRRWRRAPYVAKHRPGSWSQVALPPAAVVLPPAVEAPSALPVEVPAASPAPVAPRTELVQSGPAIRLGFSDGSSVVLDSASEQAAALRQVASSLVFKQDSADRG